MKRTIALVLAVALAASGCATTRAQSARISTEPVASASDPAVMAAYVRQLPLGARVRVSLADGQVIHGTLMKTDDDPIVVQRRTRIPETPLRIAIKDVRGLELEGKGTGMGRVVAVSIATGVGAALGFLMILAALLSD